MNTQEVFDTQVEWFTQPNQPFGFDPLRGVCVYRGINDERCGIGCVIPDSIYNPSWDKAEGKSISHLLNGVKAVKDYFSDSDKGYLGASQVLHDQHARKSFEFGETEYIMRDFLVGLRSLANSFHLDTKKLDDWLLKN